MIEPVAPREPRKVGSRLGDKLGSFIRATLARRFPYS
jgi:hypothetical protein